MIEYVLVTVNYGSKVSKDMELPAQIEVSLLKQMLLDALQTAEPQFFADKDTIQIKHHGKYIENGTLYDNKIWDGSKIEIV